MFAGILEELESRGAGTVFGFIVGAALGWVVGRLRRMQQRRLILRGDARDTVVIQHNLVQAVASAHIDGRDPQRRAGTLRIRAVGQGQLRVVVPNAHLAAELLRRAFTVAAHDPLISMQGAEGSYLLETLTNFVCDRVGNAPFEHDLYVMAPCCEPAGLAGHQPITVLLVAADDLALFEDWELCRDVTVEHGSDGARVLTLMDLARRFRREREKITGMRAARQRTRYLETMYLLDLALDKRSAAIPTRKVPWERFAAVLQELQLPAGPTGPEVPAIAK
jgi:hypothetical protein